MTIPLENMMSKNGVYACDWSHTFNVWRAFYVGANGKIGGDTDYTDGATPREAVEKAYPLALANILARSNK